jgi:hypothetical protein
LTPDGKPPLCLGCRTLERHRALHRAFSVLPRSILTWRRALQFAPDRSLDPSWFRSFEGSVYGGENSLDLVDIDRPSDSYELISLSMVLEFVRDDRRAFAELVRIGTDRCIVHITFGSTLTAESSSHFDAPKGPYGRYHDYGRDFYRWLGAPQHGLSALFGRVDDPVTGDATAKFAFLCRDRGDAETLRTTFMTDLPQSASFELAPP